MTVKFAVFQKGFKDRKGGFGGFQLPLESPDIHFSQILVCESLHELSSIPCLLADKPNQAPQTVERITMQITGLAAHYEITHEGMTNRRST